MVGAKMNVALIGEAGSGKSVAAVQVAKALNLNYFIFSFSQRVMPHDLVGFMSPITGDYVASNIRKAYELGGVLILDEFDRANTEVTILLNGMLANNDYMFPDKMVNKHEEFRIIACQNTIGVGGSKVYASARRQDGSTLNRFVKLDFNIDNDLELAVCGNTIITRAIQTIRKNVVKLGLDDILITPRQAIDGNKLVSIGFTNEEAIEHTCLVGLAPDVRKRILNNVEL
jgi:midasin (ATPase involved in ribosome maturation)